MNGEMIMMSKKKYFLFFMIFLFIEILIGMYAKGWVRYYGGDILVMPAMYFLVRTFTKKLYRTLPLILFIFAGFVEFLQYLDICGILGINKKSLLAVIIGTNGTWNDIPCYLAGMLLIYIMMILKRSVYYGRISGSNERNH